MKVATKMYHNKGAPGGLSAKETQQMVRKQFDGTGPSDQTIIRYVNDYKLVGASPVKPGNPGNIPPACIESLCVGVESYISIMQLNQRCDNDIGKMELAQLVKVLWIQKPFTRQKTISYCIGSACTKISI